MDDRGGANAAPREDLIEIAFRAVEALTEEEQELLFERLMQHCQSFYSRNPDSH